MGHVEFCLIKGILKSNSEYIDYCLFILEGVFNLKKLKYILLGFILLMGALIYKSIFYPPLPVHSISRHDVIEKINNSQGKLVKIEDNNGLQWYISKRNDNENDYAEIKQLMKEKGWNFKSQLESGSLIFQGKQGEISVSDYLWRNGNQKYIIFNFPKL